MNNFASNKTAETLGLLGIHTKKSAESYPNVVLAVLFGVTKEEEDRLKEEVKAWLPEKESDRRPFKNFVDAVWKPSPDNVVKWSNIAWSWFASPSNVQRHPTDRAAGENEIKLGQSLNVTEAIFTPLIDKVDKSELMRELAELYVHVNFPINHCLAAINDRGPQVMSDKDREELETFISGELDGIMALLRTNVRESVLTMVARPEVSQLCRVWMAGLASGIPVAGNLPIDKDHPMYTSYEKIKAYYNYAAKYFHWVKTSGGLIRVCSTWMNMVESNKVLGIRICCQSSWGVTLFHCIQGWAQGNAKKEEEKLWAVMTPETFPQYVRQSFFSLVCDKFTSVMVQLPSVELFKSLPVTVRSRLYSSWRAALIHNPDAYLDFYTKVCRKDGFILALEQMKKIYSEENPPKLSQLQKIEYIFSKMDTLTFSGDDFYNLSSGRPVSLYPNLRR